MSGLHTVLRTTTVLHQRVFTYTHMHPPVLYMSYEGPNSISRAAGVGVLFFEPGFLESEDAGAMLSVRLSYSLRTAISKHDRGQGYTAAQFLSPQSLPHSSLPSRLPHPNISPGSRVHSTAFLQNRQWYNIIKSIIVPGSIATIPQLQH